MGICLLPSIRGLAYLNAFIDLGVYPDEIILMQQDIPRLKDVRDEAEKADYNGMFFNIDIDLPAYVNGCGARVITVPANDINSPLIHESLKKCRSSYFIFTGGGILDKLTLSQGKFFIHIHPGIVSHYRGSTCFYYSLLENGSLGSTAFLMDEHIDTGNVIASTRFRMNYLIQPWQKLFMDYIVDPFIREVTLKKVLEFYLHQGYINATPQPPSYKPAYFIMHPLLRHLTIHLSNNRYNAGKPCGIFEITDKESV